ncbi:MAG: isoprenylcysteine carboxylmethyltransferase family protein [Pseudomonadota bacterium]
MKYIDIPPAWTLLFVVAAWRISVIWEIDGFGLRFAGWIIIALSLALMVWAVLVMSREKTPIFPREEPISLVTAGPFAFSRNPIYLAECTIVVGAAIAFGQPIAALLAIPLALILRTRFILPEEQRLAATFGKAWEDYARSVNRWI